MSLPLPPVLVVDDEKNMRLSLQTLLGDEGYAARAVESAEAALELLGQASGAEPAARSENFLMVISDARLGGMSGYDFLGKVRRQWPDLPVLMITAYATPKLAVEVIKAGAVDYLAKPFAPEELLHAVARCAERYRLLQDNARLRAHATETYQLDQIIGECAKMRELRQLIQTVAPTDARVLILGESGTGKELVAGALHTESARCDVRGVRSAPDTSPLTPRTYSNYVRINCAAIPEALLESELFGHEKGAFTGAVKQKPGRVEEADGGTIFLDEIADMSGPLQAKLLRFLEDGTFTRVGGTQELRVNVRLIAATNRDIVQAIADKQFREDLFHRLNVVQFRLPPLRERGEDILLLAEHFLKMFGVSMNRKVPRARGQVSGPDTSARGIAGTEAAVGRVGIIPRAEHLAPRTLSPAAQQQLLAHHWPGNVRELRNVIERALILETASEIEPGCLPDFGETARRRDGELPDSPSRRLSVSPQDASLDELLGGFERDLINATLDQNHYNLTKTAERLKISRHALRYRMQRLNIASPAEGEEE